MPIGPAARARAAQRELGDGMPPTADAFWSEDSAALHDAVQAPPGVSRKRLEPPVGLVPPVAGLRVPRLDRLQALRSLARGRRASWRWGLLALATAALLVVAVIGSTESPASHPRTSDASMSHPLVTGHSTSPSPVTSGVAARDKLASRLTAARKHARVQSRARARATRAVHHRAKAHHPATPAVTVTEQASATPTPQTSTQASVPTTSTTPTHATASTVASTGSKPAAQPAGPSRLGQIVGGCLVKCK